MAPELVLTLSIESLRSGSDHERFARGAHARQPAALLAMRVPRSGKTCLNIDCAAARKYRPGRNRPRAPQARQELPRGGKFCRVPAAKSAEFVSNPWNGNQKNGADCSSAPPKPFQNGRSFDFALSP